MSLELDISKVEKDEFLRKTLKESPFYRSQEKSVTNIGSLNGELDRYCYLLVILLGKLMSEVRKRAPVILFEYLYFIYIFT